MKSVMLSIRPQWCELIANGKKTVEVRKSRPKLETPFKCYIYETLGKKHVHYSHPGYAYDKYGMIVSSDIVEKYEHYDGSGKVIGSFVCDSISEIHYDGREEAEHCVSRQEIIDYGKWDGLLGWHISALQIYDKPRELSEFCRETGIRDRCAGQCETCSHWRYVRVNSEEFDMECECGGPLFNVLEQITRPPQSWGYVEELK